MEADQVIIEEDPRARGEADTLDKFFEEYSDRGFTCDEYTQAFGELVTRG